MPVKDQSQYPGGSLRSPEWLAIRSLVLHEQGHRCAWYGVPDGDVIAWGTGPDAGTWMRENGEVYTMEPAPRFLGLARGTEYECERLTRIVLTIAHLDQRPANNTRGNLRALCQRAHNRHDAPHRRANAARTRRAKMACGDLLETN